MHRFGQSQLFLSPEEKALGRELLGRLRGGIIDLADDAITFGMDVDPEFNALGFDNGL
jgi:hypothetical protein